MFIRFEWFRSVPVDNACVDKVGFIWTSFCVAPCVSIVILPVVMYVCDKRGGVIRYVWCLVFLFLCVMATWPHILDKYRRTITYVNFVSRLSLSRQAVNSAMTHKTS